MQPKKQFVRSAHRTQWLRPSDPSTRGNGALDALSAPITGLISGPSGSAHRTPLDSYQMGPGPGLAGALVQLCGRGLLTCTRGKPGRDGARYALPWLPLDDPQSYSARVRRLHAKNMKRFAAVPTRLVPDQAEEKRVPNEKSL